MFIQKPPAEKTTLDEAIASAYVDLNNHTAEEEEYAAVVEQLIKLDALKDKERPDRIKLDTLLLTAGNLIGILVIVGYEQKHVVTSKALPFLAKLH